VSDGHRIVNPPELPDPSGYAHAVVAGPGRTVYLGGQTGAGETVAAQFDAAAAALITDLDEYRASMGELGQVWRRHFGRRYPAMALVGVSGFADPEARVELMGVAVVADG
jgi:enamine deaminase RidA (YjgF/YER057c/UK114 family)